MKKHSVIGNHCHPEFIEGWRWLTRCKSHTSTTLSVTTLALLLCSIFIALPASAQVAIGDSLKTAHPSAELEVFSESKGFLPPRMTTAQRDSIASPADGLIVFDTDLNKLLYYHNDTWKDFGLWSTRDSTSGNIYYNGGKVVVGEGSDTSSTFGTLNVAGNIVCVAVPDSAGEAIHVFISEIDFPGEFNGNFGINTIQTNNTDGGTVGMFSYLESDAKFSVAMGGQSFYTGAGGDLDNFQEIPIVLGSMTDAYVLDTLAEALAIGSKSIAESAHKGINIGNYSSAVSPATYANIGVLAETGDSSSNPIIFIRDSFPSRFTAAALLNNSNNSANDFNVYAHGDAKSFFGGNVGIGTIAPTTKLDVAGTVNAEVYLLNGDTLGDGVWSISGNHIYFPASGTGKVAIGSGSDTSEMKATLNISGSRGIVSEVTPDSTNGAPAHVFEATLNNATGQNYRLNTIVNTLQGNSGEGISVGFVSYNEGSPENIYAIGGQAFYTGAGGSVDSNLVAGVIGDTYVEDSTAIVSAIGVLGISESNQQGINVGIYGSAYSNDAYFNIGSVALVNIPDAVSPLEIISDSFNTRFTAAGVFRNFNDSVHDFNVYAAGDAQSYFGGNVGIGKLSPASKLDVNGAVNASAYLLNGDTLGDGVWSKSGDDIIYDAGKVKIGKPFPEPYASDLSVRGNVVFTSDSAKENYIGSYFGMDVDSVWAGRWESDSINTDRHFVLFGVNDTLASDTVHAGMVMGSFDEGMATWWGCGESFDEDGQRIFIVKSPTESGIQISSYEGNNTASQIFQAGEIRSAVTNSSSDTLTTLLKTTGFGINTTNPDTELHVNGNIKQSISTRNVSNPPTDTELDSFFTSPASKGNGWTTYIQDDNTNNFYQVVASGSNWIVFTGAVAP